MRAAKTIKYKEMLSFGTKKMTLLYRGFCYTVKPRYKEVRYNKTSYNKVILLVPALYISLFFYPDIMRNLI